MHQVVVQYNILGCLCTNAGNGLLSDRDIARETGLGLCDVGTGLELLESLGYVKVKWDTQSGKGGSREQIRYEATEKGWIYWCEEWGSWK